MRLFETPVIERSESPCFHASTIYIVHKYTLQSLGRSDYSGKIINTNSRKDLATMERQIIHIDISSFAISVERIKNSQLRERPVIVAFPDIERSLVYATSCEARQAGIQRCMPLQLARKLCRDLIIVPPDHALYKRATQAMLKILTQFTPIIEPVEYGHAYMDMTGTTRLFGATKDAAAKVQREIQSRLRLESTLGVASNKLVSKIASAVIKPVSLEDVAHGTEEKFIGPQAVRYLPNIDQKIKQQLLDFNIKIIQEIAAIPLSHLNIAFGRMGIRLHQASHGIDNTPVRTPQRNPNVYEEQTLAEDSNDIQYLRGVLYRLIERAALRLRHNKRSAKKLSLEIYYSDRKNAFGQKTLPAPSNLEKELFVSAELLFKKILTRRTRVRKLAVRFFQLGPAAKQISLFPSASEAKNYQLSQAIDQIRSKLGREAIQLAIDLRA